MAILLLTFWGGGMMLLARWICGRWFNHLSLYTFMWTISLLALELRLIEYNHIVFEAWLYIFVAWVSIYLGTAIAKLIFFSPAIRAFPDLNMKRLRNAILLLSAAGFASSATLAVNILHALRTESILVALTEYANDIYTMRFEGEVSGLAYLVFVPIAGCVLAGVYTARLGRVTLTAFLPLLAMIADGVLSMQRADIVIAGLAFVFSYILTPKVAKLHVAPWTKILVGSLVLGSFMLVTAHRGVILVNEREKEALARAGESVSFLPSLYLYASGPVAGFSEYLKHPENDGKELWGRYMFASIYRFLSKFGFDTYVSYYQNFYYTPVPVNTGTYLREIHRDFGGAAVFVYPFCLGVIITLLEARRGLISIILLSFLYIVVVFSFNVNFVSGGTWYFPVPIALLVSVWAHQSRASYSLPRAATLPNGMS